jgi:hypothetical protein
MGQAKRRGTFEERQAVSMQKKATATEKRLAQEELDRQEQADIIKNMSPKARGTLILVAGLTAMGLGVV